MHFSTPFFVTLSLAAVSVVAYRSDYYESLYARDLDDLYERDLQDYYNDLRARRAAAYYDDDDDLSGLVARMDGNKPAPKPGPNAIEIKPPPPKKQSQILHDEYYAHQAEHHKETDPAKKQAWAKKVFDTRLLAKAAHKAEGGTADKGHETQLVHWAKQANQQYTWDPTVPTRRSVYLDDDDFYY